jgi:hypothetical protein
MGSPEVGTNWKSISPSSSPLLTSIIWEIDLLAVVATSARNALRGMATMSTNGPMADGLFCVEFGCRFVDHSVKMKTQACFKEREREKAVGQPAWFKVYQSMQRPTRNLHLLSSSARST